MTATDKAKAFFKKIFDALKKPPKWMAVAAFILTPVLAVGSLEIPFSEELEFIRYIMYLLSAVTFGYAIYIAVTAFKSVKNAIVKVLKKNAFMNKILEEYGYRTVVTGALSIALNLVYVIFNTVMAFTLHTTWYGVLAAYYFLLTVMRAATTRFHLTRRNRHGTPEERFTGRMVSYMLTGILLIILPVCLSFAVLDMVQNGSGYTHWGWTVYAFALYAVIKVVAAVRNIFKARRSDDYTVRALRNIGFADAMVTLLAMQTSIINAFSDDVVFYASANAIMGLAICAASLAIGLYMTINGAVKLDKIKKGEFDFIRALSTETVFYERSEKVATSGEGEEGVSAPPENGSAPPTDEENQKGDCDERQ